VRHGNGWGGEGLRDVLANVQADHLEAVETVDLLGEKERIDC
jgi:hypothetical protein